MADIAPEFRIFIGARDLSSLGYKDSVKRIVVEEDDTLADILTVDLINADEELTNDILFQEKSTIRLELGTEGDLTNFGTFVLEEPEFLFPEGTAPVVRLIGYGQGILLAETEKRRTFRQMTDSQVANQIANEYGLKTFDQDGNPTIETTPDNFEEIVQANQSDMKFLWERADLNGFLVYVEGGALHFHSMKYKSPEVTLQWGRAESAVPQFGGLDRVAYQVINAKFKVRTFLKGRKLTESNRDKLAKRGVTWTSANEPDALTAKQMTDPNLRRASKVVSGMGLQPEEFLINRGQSSNFSEVKRLATEGAKARQFIVEGSLLTRNAPKIRAKRIVTLRNLGQFSGEVYVKTARHEIDPDRRGYTVRLDIRRTTVGTLAPGTAKPKPSATSSTGTMRPDPIRDDTLRRVPISQRGIVG